jgi:cytoskeleton protein RodZ
MADIGSTLRETRIRDKIDIGAVEQATKIRAKYLRALEHEEWNVLPGPTYVKSFLRTYAEFLGLDAHMLVERYRTQFERPEELELPAFARNQPLRGRVRPPGPPSRAAVATAFAAGFVVLLFVLGITGGDEDEPSRTPAREVREPAGSGGGAGPARAERERRRSGAERETQGQVAVSVVASRGGWVCIVDAQGKPRIEGRTISGGEREGPFRSKRFRVTLGNGGGDLRVDGRLREVPDSAVPLGYVITPSGTRSLSASRRPTCEPGEEETAARQSRSGGAGQGTDNL